MPVHGEERHLMEHVRLAKSLQIPQAIHAPNGSMVRLAPGPATIIDEAPHGRLHLDGSVLTDGNDGAMKERRALSFAGSVAVTIDPRRQRSPRRRPRRHLPRPPRSRRRSRSPSAATDAQDRLGRKFDDDKRAAEEIRRTVRREIQDVWGKKALVRVEVAHVG